MGGMKYPRMIALTFACTFLVCATRAVVVAQNPIQPLAEQPVARETLTPAPARTQGEGFGPYATMVVRGAMLIDGTGGPPRGPVDIVVNQNRVTAIRNAGTPGMPLRANRPPKADYEIDGTGMYVLPGFVDLHVHAGGAPKNPDAEYPFKLWLAHGVTTVRGVPTTRSR
jgi:adenine deaminase